MKLRHTTLGRERCYAPLFSCNSTQTIIIICIFVFVCHLALLISIVGPSSFEVLPTMAPKKPRSANDFFNVAELCEKLAVLARLKFPGFDWEMEAYCKSRRGQGPDREGLAQYFQILKAVLEVAPTGLPGHMRLREVWLWLEKEYKVMAPDVRSRGKAVPIWASECADKVRIMLSHLDDLRDSGSSYCCPEVLQLVKMLKPRVPKETSSPGAPFLPLTASSSKSSVAPPPPPPPPPFPAPLPVRPRELQRGDSDGSVHLVSAFCKCGACRDGTVSEVDLLTQESTKSFASEEANAVAESVPAGRGAVKRLLADQKDAETDDKDAGGAAPPKRRICSKTKGTPSEEQKVGLKVKLVPRHTPGKEEAYVLVDGKYWCGCSKKASPDYSRIVEAVADRIRAGEVTTKEAAKKAMQDLREA